jgi:hypothetical protein
MIFFEKNKVLGVEANRVLNILWTDHLTCRGEGGYGFLFRSELDGFFKFPLRDGPFNLKGWGLCFFSKKIF